MLLNQSLHRATRSLAWRFGRYFYMRGRGDVGNTPQSNGEYALQGRLLGLRTAEPRVWMDVGTNIGEWTEEAVLQASRLGIRLDVHAFEPVDGTRELARRRLGKFENVALHALALSSTDGESIVHVSEVGAGTNSLVREPGRELSSQRTLLATLDGFLEQRGIERVQFVKCDTEGHDLAVLQGAAKSLSRGAIDVFQFEYNHRWVFSRSFLKDVFDVAESMPYTVGRLCGDGVELVPKWHPELERFFECNWVLVRNPVITQIGAFEGQFTRSNVYERTR